MLIAFFDTDGLVHHEYVPKGQTVNKKLYKTVLERLRDAVRRHRPEKWGSSDWILHHDNAPDLAPCDFFLFPQLKKTVKGRRFNYVKESEANATRQLRVITKSDYQRCFRQWQERWNKCIQAQGHYFEGDDQLAVKSTHSLTKKSVPELNDQPTGSLPGIKLIMCATATLLPSYLAS